MTFGVEAKRLDAAADLSFGRAAALAVAGHLVSVPAVLVVRSAGASELLGAAVGMAGPLGIAAWTLHRWKAPWREVLAGFGAAIPLTPWIAAGVVGHLLLLSGITHALSAVWPWFARAARALEHDFAGPPAAVALLVAVGAPLTEELLFRGVLLRGMLARYSTWHALAGSALLFAASHWFPVKVFLMLPAGVALGWLYVRYRSLWPPLLAHAMNNGFGVWLMLAAPPAAPVSSVSGGQGVAMVAAGIVLLWASYQCLRVPPEK